MSLESVIQVRNLGINMDAYFTFENHISSKVKTRFYGTLSWLQHMPYWLESGKSYPFLSLPLVSYWYLCHQLSNKGKKPQKIILKIIYHLINIVRVRRFLSWEDTETLDTVDIVISSRLDYCNALLLGIRKKRLD